MESVMEDLIERLDKRATEIHLFFFIIIYLPCNQQCNIITL